MNLFKSIAFKSIAFKSIAFKSIAFKSIAFKSIAFKSIAQGLANAALPTIKAQLAARITAVASQPQYAIVGAVLTPFLHDLLDNWTIKL